jgi:7-cyano-7-deazaguanine synthase
MKIVLLSGGIDSATALARCISGGHKCEAIGFDYGQLHKIELQRAAKLAAHFGVPFNVITLPPMPLVNDVVFAGRNLVLAAHGLSIAQQRGASAIVVGCNENDWLRFPDCRPIFWRSLERAAEAYGVAIDTPFLHSPKSHIIEMARRLKVPIEITWSCYNPQNDKPCGVCLACETRSGALAA